MLLGSKEHFAKIYDDIQRGKAEQSIKEWLDDCPANVETEFENGKYYIIRVNKYERDMTK
jgi:hypothetical protein